MGLGQRAAADGTKWDVYEQNLLSEYHIRYGGWGGIGYYHVSDTYIALFSSFIACGVWEAIYILDGSARKPLGDSSRHAACRYPRPIGDRLWPGLSVGDSADAAHSELEGSDPV